MAVDRKLVDLYDEARGDFRFFSANCLKIKDKLGNTTAFDWNSAQELLHESIEDQKRRIGRVRKIAVKGRQQGVSTYVGARFYHNSTMNRGRNTFILSHKQDTSDALFGIVERYQKNNPFAPHVGTSNVREMEFDRLDSSYYVETAGANASGRGKTTLNFHGCLSPDTWVVEPSGNARRMRDFAVGDLVRTHTGAVAPISFISNKRAETLCVKVLGANEPVVATPEHRFLTAKGKVALRDLRVGDELVYPVAKVCASAPRSWPYRLDYGRKPGRGGVGSVGPAEICATFELGRIFGLYLAEGTQRLNRVSFAVHEREVARTLAWLAPFRDCLFGEPCVYPRRGSKTVTVEINSKSFSAFVYARCGRTADKHMPKEWRENADFARGLVVGYFSGDGGGQFDRSTRRVQAPSIVSAIAFEMRDALAALGYGWASLVRREGALRNGRNEKTQWTVRLSGVGADRLWGEMGRDELPRTRKVREGNFRVENGFAHFPIVSIEDAGVHEVMDFEVDHADHSYCIWQCASSNSEAAFWPNAQAHFASSVQTVPDMDDTEVVLESTANGVTGELYERTQDAIQRKGDYELTFIPWYLQKEYKRRIPEGFELADVDEGGVFTEQEYMETFGLTVEQMVWRRNKIIELRSMALFDQEYPATVELAFQQKAEGAYHNVAHILKARKRTGVVGAGPLILGVDPAGEGGDRFAIAFRRGYVCEKIVWRDRIGHLEAVEWLKSVIDESNPAVVFIDAGGIGKPVISTLRGKGERYNMPLVRAVNFGSPSQHKMAKPKMPGPNNRRAEMQQRIAEWLALEEGVSLPDLDTLQADLIELKIKPSLTNDLLLESKQEIKKRGGRSPDLADALGLTFADLTFIREWTDSVKKPNFMQVRETSLIAPSLDDIVEYGGSGGGSWMG